MTNKPMLSVERELIFRICETKNMDEFLLAMAELRIVLNTNNKSLLEDVLFVIPDRKPLSLANEMQSSEDWFQEMGYNACLDDLEKLNGLNP